MPLSDTERNLFEDMYFEKSLPIRERYEGELKKLDYSNDTNRYSMHLSVIKDYARAEMNAQVEALINVLQRVGRYPDEEDFETFAANLAGMKNRFLLCFADRYGTPLSPLPRDLVDRNLDLLSRRLDEIIGLSLVPVRRFMSEGRLDQDRRGTQRKRQNRVVLVRVFVATMLIVASVSVVLSHSVSDWSWLQNHPNRLGLYCAAAVILAGLCWAIIDQKRRGMAFGSMVLGGVLVLVQILGR